jgi:hypothetical protein
MSRDCANCVYLGGAVHCSRTQPCTDCRARGIECTYWPKNDETPDETPPEACLQCLKEKKFCDGVKPICNECQTHHMKCEWTGNEDNGKFRYLIFSAV